MLSSTNSSTETRRQTRTHSLRFVTFWTILLRERAILMDWKRFGVFGTVWNDRSANSELLLGSCDEMLLGSSMKDAGDSSGVEASVIESPHVEKVLRITAWIGAFLVGLLSIAGPVLWWLANDIQ